MVSAFHALQFLSHPHEPASHPAMAAGVADRLWAVEDIVNLLDAAEGEPRKRGPYKPRQAAVEISK